MTLNTFPVDPSLVHMREEDNQKLTEKKALAQRPTKIGARLDASRDYFVRCRSRHEQANAILLQAQAAAAAAGTELLDAKSALTILEAELA